MFLSHNFKAYVQGATNMRILLFTNYRCFDRQIGLSNDKTKFSNRKLPGVRVLVNQTSLQMATSSKTHRQYFHVIFHVLQLILAADTTIVHRIAKTSYLVHIKMCCC